MQFNLIKVVLNFVDYLFIPESLAPSSMVYEFT